MSSKNIVHGAYHKSLAEEIDRVSKELENIGIGHPTKQEASALIAEKSKMLLLNEEQAKEFIRKMRGI